MSNTPASDESSILRLKADFERLHMAARRTPYPTATTREDRLKRLLDAVQRNAAEIERAISKDFGHRAIQETRLTEFMPIEASIKHALRHIRGWMRPKRVSTSLLYWPGKNMLLPQPLGVVGIVAPWNYPLQLTLGPAVDAIAAGNLVMLKPSEFSPEYSTVLQRLISETFSADEFIVAVGGIDVSRAFCALPFDHLLFTGSSEVGKLVAEAAARNLTPVTMELGGKCPAIVHRSADAATAANRIAYAKVLSAGQTCIAPDYVIVAPEHESLFADAFKREVARMIGNDPANPDYTSIISDRHFTRLQALLRDAIDKGAQVEHAVDDPDLWSTHRKMPPCLVLKTKAGMQVRKEEIFGPILPVVTADTDAEAIDIVNAGDRPLALYWFGKDQAALERVLHETVTGGVTVNDCIFHQVQTNQPFGGVGASGWGVYHGEWGFRTFSKEKPVFYRPSLTGIGYMQPPYGQTFDRIFSILRRLT